MTPPQQAKIATRDMLPEETHAILRAMLHASDEGVLLTDLDHVALACNRKFGELFGLDADEVVHSEPEEVRRRVYPRLSDPDGWRTQLEFIYAHPSGTFEDELTLIGPPDVWLRRRSGPVLDARGEIIGRLWQFRDVTQDKRRVRMQEVLYDLGTFHSPDPAAVCKHVVEEIARFYGDSLAILSIRNGGFMEFRFVAGPLADSLPLTRNPIEEAYCRTPMMTVKPLLIQDARLEPEFQVPATGMGFTRYLGAPVYDERGKPIGTICFLDGKSNEPLDQDDVRFLSLLAMRISAELERERLFAERMAEQRALVERQQADLAVTHEVLTAMNQAFQLMAECTETDDLIDRQLELLKGRLGYDSVTLLLTGDESESLEGRLLTGARKARPTPVKLRRDEDALILSVLHHATLGQAGFRFENHPSGDLARLMGATFVCVAPLAEHGVLVLGSRRPRPVSDPHHLTHLEALIDQVCLLLNSHLLQRKLIQTGAELRSAHERLIQSEKLSVAGTLAAGIAHDIRNILSSLSLELELGESDPREALASVKVQIDRFNLLAHRLLSYARPRLIAREPIDLNVLVQRVVTLTSAQSRIAGLFVSTEFDPNVPSLPADPNQIEHLLVNLVLNAIQAMDGRGGTITLRTRSEGRQSVLEIQDNGRGMGVEQLESLFEPFVSTRTEGFGLGLYSVKRIVAEHGWAIRVESAPRAGTTFVINIPHEAINPKRGHR
ncbi:MAG TPA: ATP-binding protein [Fimbriimonadaceae bacterium]|nr:ATP-binding protein [Fimbriimonadaceae bacterium]